MREIWEGRARSEITNQKLADHAWTIIKKGWFSDLEILEIHQQIDKESYQENNYTVIEALNTEKQEHSNRIETQNNSNRNATHPNTTEKKLTQEKNNCKDIKENYV